MKEVIYYEANDGTRFEDEYECLKYEFSKDYDPIAEMLIVWDSYGTKKKVTHRTSLEDAYAIYCSSITAAKFLKEWGDRDGISTPYDDIDIEGGDEVPLGTFVWFSDEWRTVDKIVEQFDKMKHQMELGEEKIALPEDL